MNSDATSEAPPLTETAPIATLTLPPKPTTTAPVVEAPPATVKPAEASAHVMHTVTTPPPQVLPVLTIEPPIAQAMPAEISAPALPVPALFEAATVAHAPVPVSVLIAVPQIKPPSVPTAVLSSPIPAAAAKSKSKKKKNQPIVTMATAATATSGGPGTQGENTGRWTAEEHRLFLQGLEQHGKGWKKIASLIKSRTVVQIRTHAQKYFQKLAKARQNGEEGEISMEGRGGPTSVTSGGMPGLGLPNSKRRRQTTGTKRKAITSVVSSATREGKTIAASHVSAGVPCPVPPLPAVAPALAPFVVPHPPHQPNANTSIPTVPAIPTSHGSVLGAALEDSLFRFLTPAPVHVGNDGVQVNEVARQAGANPITLPSDYPSTFPPHASGGEVSPTGVTDCAIFPCWTDVKDMPSWYAKGADIDCLLDVADTLDWLTDTGDLHETYEPPASQSSACHVPSSFADPSESSDLPMLKAPSAATLSVASLSSCVEDVVPPLPCLFESDSSSKRQKTSSHDLSDLDDHLDVFDTPMEEHAFVSALLENNGESSGSLALS